MGNTHIVEFLDEARKARKNAASGAQSQHLEAATGSSAVEGTAALVKAAARAKEQLLKRRREGRMVHLLVSMKRGRSVSRRGAGAR